MSGRGHCDKRFDGDSIPRTMAFTLVAPERPEEACALLADRDHGTAMVLAGGTDLLLDLDEGRFRPQRVVSLRNLPWRYLTWDGPALRIGSTLPLSDLEADPRVRAELPGLHSAVAAVGSLALRHRATLGGNLGRSAPASDLLPILLALDARVNLVGLEGPRTLAVDDFILGSRRTALSPDELIESVTVPAAVRCAYVWQRVRPANDISQVGVAVAGRTDGPGWRVALGGVPPRPTRVRAAEAILRSATPAADEVDAASRAASQNAPFVTDKRATEGYRRHLVGTLVRRAIETAVRTSRTSPS
jgi:CO/xanthine dehydrogenase FAD-binding subunit